MGVFVDAREMKYVAAMGKDYIPDIQVRTLKTGDVVVYEIVDDEVVLGDLAVERKEITDYVGSILDGRLFSQAKRLREEFKNPYIIVVGELQELWEDPRYGWFTEAHWYGSMATLLEKYGVDVVIVPTEEEFWYFITKLIEKHNDNKPIRNHNTFLPNTEEPYFDMLMRVDGVGAVKARAILEKISFYDLWSCDVEDLLEVDGIGPAFAKRVKETFDIDRCRAETGGG